VGGFDSEGSEAPTEYPQGSLRRQARRRNPGSPREQEQAPAPFGLWVLRSQSGGVASRLAARALGVGLGAGCARASVWHLATGLCRARLAVDEGVMCSRGRFPTVRTSGAEGVGCVRFDEDGVLFASGCANGALRVYHADRLSDVASTGSLDVHPVSGDGNGRRCGCTFGFMSAVTV
jgi:hypothetical protein